MAFLDWLTFFAELGERTAGRKAVTKQDTALRFGILGAANIGYGYLIIKQVVTQQGNLTRALVLPHCSFLRDRM